MKKKQNSNNSIFDTLATAYILKLIWKPLLVILIFILILFIWGYIKFAKPVYDEDEALGYSSFETVRIDPMTGEKIPKAELETYSNDDLILYKSDGTAISFKEINEYRDILYDLVQGKVKDEEMEETTKYCELLIVQDLECTYYISDNKLYINDTWISGEVDFKNTINEIVKDKYRDQNGLE